MAPRKKRRVSKSKKPKTRTKAKAKTRSKPRKTRAKKKVQTRIQRKRSVGKTKTAKNGFSQTLDQINKVIARFEGEVETLVIKFMKQGERSRKDLRKNFNVLVKKIRAGKLLALTRDRRDDLEKEVRRLAEEVVGTVKDVEALINSEKVSGLFANARDGLANVVEVLAENGLVLQAKQTIKDTRREVLGLLSIPTQNEVEKLERKIITLEKRLSNLARRAA